MLQQPALGTRTRVVLTILLAGVCGAVVLWLCGTALGFGALGVTAGLAGALVASVFVAALLRNWTWSPLVDLARRSESLGSSDRARSGSAPEALVDSLVRHIDELDRARGASVKAIAESRSAADEDLQRARAQAAEIAATLEHQSLREARGQRVQRLHYLTLDPILLQLGRAIERVIAIDTQPAAARPLLRVARAAALWAEEAIALLQRVSEPGEPLGEPYALRDEVGTLARAIALGLGRELSLRFSSEFPAQASTDRTRLRLAILAVGQLVARRDPEGELVLDATFIEHPGKPGRVQITIDGRGGLAPLSPVGPAAEGDLAALSELVRPVGGEVLTSEEPFRLGFQLEAKRHRRTTGTTLYGVGALAERSVLVIDQRPRGRALLCEQLVNWRMTPTATADVAGALEAIELAERAKKPFDLVVVCPRLPGVRSDGTPPELNEMARHPAFRQLKLLSLEAFDTLTASLPAAAAALEPQRLARPSPPLEVLEALTMMLAPKPGTRAATTERARPQGALAILVVEDNPVNQALLAKMLERRGHLPTLTGNGADAVDRLQESPGAYDVVLMDIQMPVMDGYEATTVIRMREAQSRSARIPIIAVTAHAMSGEREKCLEAGMDGYLSKPVSEAELLATIDETVRRIRQPTPPGQPPVDPAAASDTFDARRVLEFAAGDQAFLRTLVDIFAETAPKQLAAIEQAVLAKDGGALLRAAHQLKGSVGNFAAERSRRLAADLEEQGRKKEFGPAAATLVALRAEIELLGQGLRRLVASD